MRTRRHALIPAPARRGAWPLLTTDEDAVVSLLLDGPIDLTPLRPSGR